jgi:NADPH:quinone reductase-like Zn-dependent oxidoreductase
VVRVIQSTIIDAPVAAVWRVLRDFNGHDRWHPAIAASAIEGGQPVDMVGAVRRFRLAEGGELREQLLSLSDERRTLTYCLLEAPLPLMGYVATIRLKPVTDGDRTFWEWRSEFRPPEHRREELVSLVRDSVYRAGFEAIRRMFGAGRPPLRPADISDEPKYRPATSPPIGADDRKAIAAGGEEGRALAGRSAFAELDALPLTHPRGGGEVARAARRTGGSGADRSLLEVRGGTATDLPPGTLLAAEPTSVPSRTTLAIVVERYGGPEVLQPKDVLLPRRPAPGEVLVRHTVIGVNFIDVYCRTGYFDLLTPPGVPGMEAAGVIEEVGQGVSLVAPGDRVAYACPPVGAYTERRTMSPELMVRLPADIPDEIAAAGLLKGVTASFLLHDVHSVRAGQFVVIHAAAGGVGQLLVQWARDLGATVIGTVSDDEKARIAGRLGAQHAIVRGRENFADAVMRITGGRGADVIYDAVGADTFGSSLEALAVRGHLVSFGQASGSVGSWDIGQFASKSVTLSRPNYGHYTDTREKLLPHVERFFGMLRAGRIAIAPPTRYPLERAAGAHRDLEARRTTGSLVLVP